MKKYYNIPDTIYIFGGVEFDSIVICENYAISEDKFIEYYENISGTEWNYNEVDKKYLANFLKNYCVKYGIYQ